MIHNIFKFPDDASTPMIACDSQFYIHDFYKESGCYWHTLLVSTVIDILSGHALKTHEHCATATGLGWSAFE